jgi:hypothetical protein
MEFPSFFFDSVPLSKTEAAGRISYPMQTETENRAYSSRRTAMGSTFIKWRWGCWLPRALYLSAR